MEAWTPLPAPAAVVPAGSRSGGQMLAHSPVQVTFPPDSTLSRYRVLPVEPSTSTVPTPGTALASTWGPPDPAPGLPGPPPVVEWFAQAASRTTAAAANDARRFMSFILLSSVSLGCLIRRYGRVGRA